MNYKKKKGELIKLREEVLKSYQTLYDKTIKYAESEKTKPTSVEVDALGQKIRSLIAALLYVECPNNPDVVATLRRDMVIIKNGRK